MKIIRFIRVIRSILQLGQRAKCERPLPILRLPGVTAWRLNHYSSLFTGIFGHLFKSQTKTGLCGLFYQRQIDRVAPQVPVRLRVSPLRIWFYLPQDISRYMKDILAIGCLLLYTCLVIKLKK